MILLEFHPYKHNFYVKAIVICKAFDIYINFSFPEVTINTQ